MANYRVLVRHFPAAVDYLRGLKWLRRGDVLAYAPSVRTRSFSTDAYGFRHSWFEGRDIGIADARERVKIGLLLGSSHIFGFGLGKNSETLASQLSQALGYPFFGIAFPEADSRTLHASLLRLLPQLADQLGLVILVTGGDFTRYCYWERADPLFGSPALSLSKAETGPADEARQFANLLYFNSFWSQRCTELARAAGVRLCFGDDITFFEKSQPDEVEGACELGQARGKAQQSRFGAHARRALDFQKHRRSFAKEQNLMLACFPPPDDLLYIDEYHYRAESQRHIAETLAAQLG